MILPMYLTQNQLNALKQCKNVDIDRFDDFIAWLSPKYNVIAVHPFFDTIANKVAFIEIDIEDRNCSSTHDANISKQIKEEIKKAGFSEFNDLIYFICVKKLVSDNSIVIINA